MRIVERHFCSRTVIANDCGLSSDSAYGCAIPTQAEALVASGAAFGG